LAAIPIDKTTSFPAFVTSDIGVFGYIGIF